MGVTVGVEVGVAAAAATPWAVVGSPRMVGVHGSRRRRRRPADPRAAVAVVGKGGGGGGERGDVVVSGQSGAPHDRMASISAQSRRGRRNSQRRTGGRRSRGAVETAEACGDGGRARRPDGAPSPSPDPPLLLAPAPLARRSSRPRRGAARVRASRTAALTTSTSDGVVTRLRLVPHAATPLPSLASPSSPPPPPPPVAMRRMTRSYAPDSACTSAPPRPPLAPPPPLQPIPDAARVDAMRAIVVTATAAALVMDGTLAIFLPCPRNAPA